MSVESIIAVVQGLRKWETLRSLGVRRSGQIWYFDPYPRPVAVSTKDLLIGFRRYDGKPPEMREWATFILAAAGLISLEQIETAPSGEALIEALWDASAGDRVDVKRLESSGVEG